MAAYLSLIFIYINKIFFYESLLILAPSWCLGLSTYMYTIPWVYTLHGTPFSVMALHYSCIPGWFLLTGLPWIPPCCSTPSEKPCYIVSVSAFIFPILYVKPIRLLLNQRIPAGSSSGCLLKHFMLSAVPEVLRFPADFYSLSAADKCNVILMRL